MLCASQSEEFLTMKEKLAGKCIVEYGEKQTVTMNKHVNDLSLPRLYLSSTD